MTAETTAPRVAYESQLLDYYLGVGVNADALMRISIDRPDLEIRIWRGSLRIAYRGEGDQYWAGICDIESTVDDWQRAVSYVGKVTKR